MDDTFGPLTQLHVCMTYSGLSDSGAGHGAAAPSWSRERAAGLLCGQETSHVAVVVQQRRVPGAAGGVSGRSCRD